ncbi:MAG: hypothetical protein IPG17_03525 [Sandaracinaceae bacterium]|nr:hypothetical protein [Sandaracinaceae bacterium]
MLPRFHLPLAVLLLLTALACDRGDAPAVGPLPAPRPVRRDPPPTVADPAPEPRATTLCQRLDAERGALDLGAPLHARVTSFEGRARAWLTRTDVSPAARGALEALLQDRTSSMALLALHDARADFAADPTLPVDATLAALVATDAAPPPGSNARVVALLAQARGWLPGDAAIPWIEALLVPERGGRRALLDEAFAAGARDPALLLALARAATREGDAAAALAALNALPPAGPAAQDPPLGAALRERAEATQLALSALHRSELSGITVWAASSLPDDASTQLARAVRADLDAAARLLGGPARPRLVVWVHASLDDFSAATCGTSWSQAFYDGVLHVVLVGQQLDATLLRSARHEALHAQLDFLTPLAPRWLQEGLAQRFAEEPFDPNAPRGSAPLTSAELQSIDRDLGLGSDGTTAGAAYARARLAIEQLVARSGDRGFAQAVTALRAGLPPAALPEQLGFASAEP